MGRGAAQFTGVIRDCYWSDTWRHWSVKWRHGATGVISDLEGHRNIPFSVSVVPAFRIFQFPAMGVACHSITLKNAVVNAHRMVVRAHHSTSTPSALVRVAH